MGITIVRAKWGIMGLDLCLAPSYVWQGDIQRWLRHLGKAAKKYCLYSSAWPLIINHSFPVLTLEKYESLGVGLRLQLRLNWLATPSNLASTDITVPDVLYL